MKMVQMPCVGQNRIVQEKRCQHAIAVHCLRTVGSALATENCDGAMLRRSDE